MAQFSRTWWGQRFIAALEEFTDESRLGRGRSYAHGGRILDYTLANGTVTARVRGSINPYFGVYKEPIYTTSITIKAISAANWQQVIRQIASRADLVTRLLMNEMPDTLEEAFSALNLHLLPHSERDFVTKCSCPDYANPCKHIAGVYYLLASALDNDPFLMFELRGLSRDDLHTELARSPLGQNLSIRTPHKRCSCCSGASCIVLHQPDQGTSCRNSDQPQRVLDWRKETACTVSQHVTSQRPGTTDQEARGLSTILAQRPVIH